MNPKEKRAATNGPQVVPSRRKESHNLASPKLTQFPDEQSKESYDRLLQRSGLPLSLCGDLTFNCNSSERLDLAMNAEQWIRELELGRFSWNEWGRSSYVPSNSPGLLFSGPPGAGKSLLAALVTRHVLFQGLVGIRPRCNVVWISASQFLMDCRHASTGRADESEAEFWERYETASLVVVDDVGTHDLNVWESGRLCHLIEQRLANCQCLFVTTNLPRNELARAIGKRAASRLKLLPSIGRFPMEDYRDRLTGGEQ